MKKDLFGNTIDEPVDAASEELSNYDKDSFNERLIRLKYINKIYHFGTRVFGSNESVRIFDEAIHCYIFGQFVATIILAQAFIERRFQEYFHIRMDAKRAKYSLDKLLKEFRANQFIDEHFVEKIDKIRLKRNPFVHHKEPLHKDSLMSRSYNSSIDPDQLLEDDAKDALSLMMAISCMQIL